MELNENEFNIGYTTNPKPKQNQSKTQSNTLDAGS